MSYVAYPRLDQWGAAKLVKEIARLAPSELRDSAAVSCPRTAYHPTASRRVTGDALEELREVALAQVGGLPESSAGRREFDLRMGGLLVSLEDLTPAEGGLAETWNHMSLVLLPDLVVWRWPHKDGESLPRDRWMGGHRNALRRVWWQTKLLGEELVHFLSADELVGIVERTSSLGSSPGVARSYARVLQEAVVQGQVPGVLREDIARAYARGARRRGAVLALPALSETKLEGLFRGVLEEVLEEFEVEPTVGRGAVRWPQEVWRS